MSTSGILVDAGTALASALLCYHLLRHLSRQRGGAEKADRPVFRFPNLLGHPRRAVRIAVRGYWVLVVGFWALMSATHIHRWRQVAAVSAEPHRLAARQLTVDLALFAVALALVFGLGALAMWVMRRRGEGGRA